MSLLSVDTKSQQHVRAAVVRTNHAVEGKHLICTGVFGFDNSVILEGRPYGSCAILRNSTMLANVVTISVNSRRICAVRVCSSNWKLLLVNVYMPYKNDSVSTV